MDLSESHPIDEHATEGVGEPGGKTGRARCRFRVNGWGLCRVGVFAGIGALAAATVSLRAAAARTRESLGEVGRSLLDHGGTLGPWTAVIVNGGTMYAGGIRVGIDPATVLDRIQAYCHDAGATDDPDWLQATLRETPSDSAQRTGSGGLGISREQTDGAGSVVCLRPPGPRGSLRQWLTGLRTFAETGDLAALGNLRYVYARRGDHGTEVAAVWTRGPLNLPEMVMFQGDAPGRDVDRVPRPANSRRILSAEMVGRQYGIHSYECAGPATHELAAYDELLPQLGWLRVANRATADARLNETSRAFVQRGATIILDVASEPGSTRLDIVEMGSAGAIGIGALGDP
jgi:hypothetical protein